MKMLFFKNVMPMVVITLGITGAFVTTSMQSAAKVAGPQTGYQPNASGGCSNISAQCDNVQKTYLCRIGGGTSGVQAFGKDPIDNSCSVTLWRPQ